MNRKDHYKSNKTTRSKGWIGTRVTVCGKPIRPEDTNVDFICLLPPGHSPTHLHSTLAMTDTDTILTLVLNDEKGIVQWRE